MTANSDAYTFHPLSIKSERLKFTFPYNYNIRMSNLPNSAFQKLKTIVVLILLIWQMHYPQKIPKKNPSFEIASTVLKKCWTYSLSNSADISFASDNVSNLLIPLVDGKLLSLDPFTGDKQWETELGGNIIALPIIDGGTIYTAAEYNGEQNNDNLKNNSLKNENPSDNTIILRALDKSTGVTQWQSLLEPVKRLYLFSFGNNIVSVGDNGQVSSVNKIDGKTVWKKRLEANLSALPFANNFEVFLGTDENRVLKLSVVDGHITEEWNTPAPPTVIIENTGKNKLIVGDRKGNLISLNKKLDKKTQMIEWKVRNGAEISSVTLTSQGILISSFDNFIYLISENSGRLLWKKRFSGRIIAAPVVLDNYFIVSATDESIAIIAELNGGRAVNRITLEDDNFFTGLPLKTGNVLVYSTLKGVFGYSFNSGCAINGKPED